MGGVLFIRGSVVAFVCVPLCVGPVMLVFEEEGTGAGAIEGAILAGVEVSFVEIGLVVAAAVLDVEACVTAEISVDGAISSMAKLIVGDSCNPHNDDGNFF